MATLLADGARLEHLAGGGIWVEGPLWTTAGLLRWSAELDITASPGLHRLCTTTRDARGDRPRLDA